MSPAPDSAAVTQMAPFAIHVPTVSNPEDYEYLPGHFVVREVLEVSDSPTELTYTVRLQSGERETVSDTHVVQTAVMFAWLISHLADAIQSIDRTRKRCAGTRGAGRRLRLK